MKKKIIKNRRETKKKLIELICDEAFLFLPIRMISAKYGVSHEFVRQIIKFKLGQNFVDMIKVYRKKAVKSWRHSPEEIEKIKTKDSVLNKKWYKKNKEKVKIGYTKFRKNNRPRVRELWRNYYYRTLPARKAYAKKYYLENKDIILGRAKKYQREHPERIKAYNKKYEYENREEINAKARKRHLKNKSKNKGRIK